MLLGREKYLNIEKLKNKVSLKKNAGSKESLSSKDKQIKVKLCSDYIADLIKKLEFRLTVVLILLRIKFRHKQISVPKISIYMDVKNSLYQPLLVNFDFERTYIKWCYANPGFELVKQN